MINHNNNNTRNERVAGPQKTISLGQKSPLDNPRNNTLLSPDQMRNKIKEQANRLQNLETYKVICEKKIKQLVPNHPLPVTEADLSNNYKIFGQEHNLNKNISEKSYIQLLENKEHDILELNKKIENLENKLKNTCGAFSAISYNNSHQNINNILSPAYLDKFPIDKLKDNYAKLFQQFKDTQADREEVLELLRNETEVK